MRYDDIIVRKIDNTYSNGKELHYMSNGYCIKIKTLFVYSDGTTIATALSKLIGKNIIKKCWHL